MSLDAEYPPPFKLKKNELKTLKFLYTQTYITKHFPELASAAEIYYYNLRDLKKLKKSRFSFEAPLNVYIEGKIHRAYIGVNVLDTEVRRDQYIYNLVSYTLSVCTKGKSMIDLLRKFHFDYSADNDNTKQPQPIFHLQYGGKLSKYLVDQGLNDAALHAWLSVPRLNHHPLTLALLLDIVFCEFQSEDTHCIKEREEWRSLIKENEKLVVEPFYAKMHQFIQSSNYNVNCLIRDFCYNNG